MATPRFTTAEREEIARLEERRKDAVSAIAQARRARIDPQQKDHREAIRLRDRCERRIEEITAAGERRGELDEMPVADVVDRIRR